MPRFSVIIPVRDRPELLERAVSSVEAQTFPDWECRIIDDGSVSPHPRFREFPSAVENSSENCFYEYFPESRGVSWARNQGFRQSRGEWIAFLDSDDEWLPEKLAEADLFIKSYPELLIFQTGEIWIRGGKRVNPPAHLNKKGGYIFPESLERCMITASSVVIHRSLLEEYPWDERLLACEDYDLWIRLASRYPVGLLPDPLTIRYQDYGGRQLSQEYPIMDRFRLYALKKFIQKSTGDKQRAAAAVLSRKIRVILAGARKRKNFGLWIRIFLIYRLWLTWRGEKMDK